MLFTDRLFLSRYSMETIAAALPSGAMVFTISSFFQGLVAYVSVFAAQYIGAGRPDRSAAALWQGIYMAFVAGALIGLTYFIAPWIFSLGKHPAAVQALEVTYYRILAVPTVVTLIYFAMSSYLAGIGRTRVVMWGNLLGAFVNIPLTGGLVFGVSIGGLQILPEWGMAGAGIATVVSWFVTVFFFIYLIFVKMETRREVFKARAIDFSLLKRMTVYGSPGGLQRFLEMAGFTFFAFIVGRLGEFYLAANNIVFSIEALSFFPMVGVGATVSILVGQSIGQGQPEVARRAVVSGMVVSSCYLLLISAIFLLLPHPILNVFMAKGYDEATANSLINMGVVLLRFVVAYTIFDGIYLCCFGALSGAGDVFFPMALMGIAGVFCMALPAWALFALGWANIHSLWTTFVFYVLVLTAFAAWRYRLGKWKSMRVIENAVDL
jgi:MATE family multidrug resistance protein